MQAQLIEAPASDSTREYQTLAYLAAYDAVLNDDYAFVAYKETDRGSSPSAWRIRIKGRHTTGVVFEPEAMRLQARAAGAQGKPFFLWGNTVEPSAGDPRRIEFRVHVKDGGPASIEMVLQLRKFDHTADEARAAMFDWPA